jgi:hypothetical protein
MRRLVLAVSAAALVVALPGVATAHELDHPAPTFTAGAPLSTAFNAGGEGADWELITSFPTGNPHSDIEFFTQNGEVYVSAGTIGTGPNGGGQTIFQLTQEGGETVAPSYVSNHPSAACLSDPLSALGLQHDVEASPKGALTILNTDWGDLADSSDAQVLLDASDAEGRCHDGGDLGFGAPKGGLEIVDITDVTNPVEIGLTSHIGEAHTVNVDPKRPHIAYAVTSDAVGVSDWDGNGPRRENENPDDSDRSDLDGFEIVDFSSCLFDGAYQKDGLDPASLTVEQKRELCRPEVFRFRYPTLEMSLGHTSQGTIYGCHELEVYPEDRLTCGSGAAMILFDIAGLFDHNGTPDDFTDDTVNGEPLPCRLRDTTSQPPFTTGAKITDCVEGEAGADLTVPGWLDLGAPSVEGIEHVGSAHHMGRGAGGTLTPTYHSTEDIDFNHEAEFTQSRQFVISTDERGGGVVPPGASCSPGADNTRGNGGLHAYAVDRLDTQLPGSAEEAWDAYARTPEGDKAIWRAEVRTQPQGSFCTAHVFQQIPGQNRIFMGWYSQGTQVVDFVERDDGTLEFREAGWFIPEGANTWVSHVFKTQENEDGTFTYWGATGDFYFGTTGRSAVDVYKVTLPAPPEPAGDGEGGSSPGDGDGDDQQGRACDEDRPGKGDDKNPRCDDTAPRPGKGGGKPSAGLAAGFAGNRGEDTGLWLLALSVIGVAAPGLRRR